MRFTPEEIEGWRRGVPRCVAGVLACFLAADVVHFSVALRHAESTPKAPAPAAVPRLSRSDIQKILNAHLFGVGAATADLERPLGNRPALALAGTIATDDPHEGYAILGEKGKAARVYRAGADLDRTLGARLDEVFMDRVVVDFRGARAILRLPTEVSAGSGSENLPPIEARTAPAADDSLPRTAVLNTPMQPVTPLESLFGGLDARPRQATGEPVMFLLHPNPLLQRQYGLRNGDVLTAINGVEVTDAETLRDALKAGGDSLTVTYARDGVEQTLSLTVPN